MVQLVGLPIISHQSCLDFRKLMNKLLQQNPFNPNPSIPQWAFSSGNESENEKSKCILIIPNPLYSVVHGPYTLVITKDFCAALLTPEGGTFDVGKVRSLVDYEFFPGAVLLVVLLRLPSDAFMGGTLYVIDVLSVNGTLLANSRIEERKIMAQTLPSILTFADRYKFSACSSITHKQSMRINNFATPIYLK